MSLRGGKKRGPQKRGLKTRARILDATLACLAECGYAATTTVMVCRRSATSRGSLLHQFPTRADLMASAVEHLFASLTATYVERFAAIGDHADRVGAAVDLLRDLYRDPRLPAVLELYVAARTDAVLRASLEPVARRHRTRVLQLASDSFPEESRLPGYAALLGLTLDALQGFAVRRMIHADDGPDTVATIKALLSDAATQTGVRIDGKQTG